MRSEKNIQNVAGTTAGAENPPVPVKKIDRTTYIVRIHFSETSTETMSDKIKRMLKMRYGRCKRSGPESVTVSGPAIQSCFYSMLRNSAGVMIFGFSKPDSRKSLSPVSRTSALAAIAALKMGRSSASLTCDSDVFSSVGMGTNSSVSKAIERNLSNAA